MIDGMRDSEALWEVIATVRDAAPRAASDADSYEIVDAIYDKWLVKRDARIREAVARALIDHYGMVSTNPVLVAFDQAARG